MRTTLALLVSCAAACPVNAGPVEAAPQPRLLERAVVESSLATGGRHIRQFAFDANPSTYFSSEENARKSDHLTLRFDHPVLLRSIRVETGSPAGASILADGILEVSTDGTAFTKLAGFEKGIAAARSAPHPVCAVRIRPTADLAHPLVVREIAIDSEPRVAIFRYPIEFSLDVSDAPAMKPWGEKTIRVCERHYAMICDELASEGFTPPTRIHMSLKSSYKGVAAAGGGRITGSVKYFQDHPNDIGAMVHETTHCVQSYRGRNLPGWLVEGIADYVRFWKYEPGKAGRLQPERARYNGSYRVTAAFLAFVSAKYDPRMVNKLNALLREGKYDAGVWKALTGKSIEELNQEWRSSLARR